MSVLPSIIIQDTLKRGILDLRKSPWKIAQLFGNVPQSFVDEFHRVFTDIAVDITLSYPREESQFPLIAILLQNEQEAIKTIGNVLGAGYNSSAGLNASSDWFYSKGVTESSSNYSREIIGEPKRLFESDDNKYKELRGSGFSANYLLQVMTDNQEYTIFLYTIIKHIMLSNIPYFARKGLYDFSLGGTDFAPEAIREPNFIFLRGLIVTFTYFVEHFYVYAEEPDAPALASSFVLDVQDGRSGVWCLGSMQSPHILSILPISAAQGVSDLSVTVSGINFQTGATVSMFPDPVYDTFDAAGEKVIYIIVTNVEISDEIFDIKFSPTVSGQSNSSTIEYKVTSTDVVPSDLLEGMFLRVINPSTHGAYGEHRRIISFTSGMGGSIRVADAFSSSLEGAFVEVFQRLNDVTFSVSVVSDAPQVIYSITLTNPDNMSDTLADAFTVT